MIDLQDDLLRYVNEIKDGNLSAFDKIYDLTKKQVFYTAFSILNSEDLVQEVMQETYIDFLNSINKINGHKSIMAYLCVISKNKALNMYKVKKRELSIDTFTNLDTFANEHIKYEDNYLYKRAKEILKNDEFQVLIYHVLSEMTFKEISLVLKKPLGTVLWIYNNSIKKIKKGLGEEYVR